MPAIVRQPMSRSLANDLLTDLKSLSSHYYIGIAKSDVFNPLDTVVDPIDSPREEREFRNNLQSIKRIEDASIVAKRVDWSYGTRYSGWDDSISSDIVEPWTPWYVMNDAKEVYICLVNPLDETGAPRASTIEPNYGLHAPMSPETDPDAPMFGMREWWKPFTLADGYTWQFLYSLTPERIFQFLSSNHIPVQEAEPSLPVGDSIEDLQWHVKNEAIGGQILSIKVIKNGSGFSQDAVPPVYIYGDGTGASATAHVSTNGQVVKITMDDFGSGYSYANVVVGDDTSNCSARPVITSKNGIGYNPIDDLKTSSVMCNIKPDGTVDDTFIVRNTFRQIGLIKAPDTTLTESDGTPIPFTGLSAKVLNQMTLLNSAPFEKGGLITGSLSGAQAWVDDVDGLVVYYHQNESTGFKPFIEYQNPNDPTSQGEPVVQDGLILTGQIDTLAPSVDMDRFSGEVLYIENRARIRRDEEQQEDIKIVITV